MKNISLFRKLLSEVHKERNRAKKAVDARDLEALRQELLKMQMDIDLMVGHVKLQMEQA